MTNSLLNSIVKEDKKATYSGPFSKFLHGSIRAKSLKEKVTDKSLAKDLSVFVTENSTMKVPLSDLKKTLFKHFKKAAYNEELAQRAWGKLVNEAAKKYTDNVIHEERLWEEIFSNEVRSKVINELEQDFYMELKKGKVNIEELYND